jgi:hypothetical protein
MGEQYTYKDAIISLRESQKKFDYFVLGITLAFLAFTVEQFVFQKTYIYYYLVPVGWGFLLISFIAGLFRLESINSFLTYEVKKLQFEPKAKNFELAQNGGAIIVKDKLGKETWKPDEIKSENDKIKKIMEIIEQNEDKFLKRSLKGYQIQKWTLILGIVAIIVFKIVNLIILDNITKL